VTGTRAAPSSSRIDSFRGRYYFLANTDDSPLRWQGVDYPTAEHAFHAGKTLDQNLRQMIAAAPTWREAKAMGRKLQLHVSRTEWNNQVRHEVMAEVLAEKFAIPSFRDRLIATGTALLIEGNTHHDQDWGDCSCPQDSSRPGANFLGKALMRQRELLNPRIAGRYVRVAATGHRPGGIGPGLPQEERDELRAWVRHQLDRIASKLVGEHGMEVAISGLAMGSDLWWADAAHKAGARVWGYMPFPEQDQRYPQMWKKHRADVIGYAEHVQHLGQTFHNALYHGRDRLMVRDADALVAVIDPTRQEGGTVATYRHAKACGIPVIRVNVHAQDVRLVGGAP
jgi:ribA/ribD-fused uncharacterized protein